MTLDATFPVTPDQDLVASPCIGVCTVDRAHSLCIGCLRTLQEIGAWRLMTVAEKRATVAACEERAKTMARRDKAGQPLP